MAASTFDTQDVVPEISKENELGVANIDDVDESLVVKGAKRKRNARKRLTTADLIRNPKGFTSLYEQSFANFKPSYTNPVVDLEKLIQRYVDWAFMINPVDFSEFLHQLKTLKKDEINQYLNELREQQYEKIYNVKRRRQQKQDEDYEAAYNGPQIITGSLSDDEDDSGDGDKNVEQTSTEQQLQQSIGPHHSKVREETPISIEERIRRNRELAQEKLKQKKLKLTRPQQPQPDPSSSLVIPKQPEPNTSSAFPDEDELEELLAQEAMQQQEAHAEEEPDQDEFEVAFGNDTQISQTQPTQIVR